MTQTSADGLAYLKACAALGLDPNTREKVGNGANARDRGNKVPKSERVASGESLTAMTKRLQREREAENKQRWLEHCDHMYKQHIGIAREWAQRYEAIADGGSGV